MVDFFIGKKCMQSNLRKILLKKGLEFLLACEQRSERVEDEIRTRAQQVLQVDDHCVHFRQQIITFVLSAMISVFNSNIR